MENTWIAIVLLLLVAISFFYAGFKDEHPRGPIGWVRKIAGAFFATVGAIFLGSFGFNLALFEEERGNAITPENSKMKK